MGITSQILNFYAQLVSEGPLTTLLVKTIYLTYLE